MIIIVMSMISWMRENKILTWGIPYFTHKSVQSVASPAEGCSIQASTARRSAPDTRRPPAKDTCWMGHKMSSNIQQRMLLEF